VKGRNGRKLPRRRHSKPARLICPWAVPGSRFWPVTITPACGTSRYSGSPASGAVDVTTAPGSRTDTSVRPESSAREAVNSLTLARCSGVTPVTSSLDTSAATADVAADQGRQPLGVQRLISVHGRRDRGHERRQILRITHHAIHPPSTMRFEPVMYREASEARKTTAPLNSSASAILPIGMRAV